MRSLRVRPQGQHRHRGAVAPVGVAVLLLVGATAAAGIEPAPPVEPGTTVRTSADAGDTGGRELAAVSATGRFVTFVGRGEGKGVWLVDRWSGTTEHLTTGDHFNPTISDDGRFVAFAEYGASRNVQLLDRASGTTTVVSVADDESASSGLADFPSLDATGRFVAFQSTDPDLDPRVTPAPAGGGPTKVYVRDTQLGETHMVSVTDDGVAAKGNAIKPDITPDGTMVAFASDATNIDPVEVPAVVLAEEEPTTLPQQIYVHDRALGVTDRVSVDSSGIPGAAASAVTFGPTISGNGRYVAFESDAANLVAEDTNNDRDAFVHDRDTATTVRVSVDASGAQLDLPDPPPVILADAPTVAVAGGGPAISGNGATVAFQSAADITSDDVNGVVDVYLHDLVAGALDERASVAIPGGTDATGTRVDGHTGETVPQINGADATISWSGLDVLFTTNGDLADDRPIAEEEAVALAEEEVSSEPAIFTRTRVMNPVAPDPGFPDVTATHPFFDEVAWAVDQGIATGYVDGTFGPARPVTRQAAAAFLYRLAGSPSGPFADPGFTDVPATSPFFTAISWMAAEGITTGYPDGTFRPAAPVTRQASMMFIHRFASEPAGPFPAPAYTDLTSAATSYQAVAWGTANGLTGGYVDGTFKPGANMSRQGMVTILYRFVPVAAVS